jgi:hypothetical protein
MKQKVDAMKNVLLTAAIGFWVMGCALPSPPDYTAFRASRPRSILVLPPENESTAVEATYGCLSTVSKPLAERGYYVYPVGVVDQYMKNNGLPTAGEMWSVPVRKLHEVFGADAVLYITIKDYGTEHLIIAGSITVAVNGRLVDARTGIALWEGVGIGQVQLGSGTIFDVILVPIEVAHANTTDRAHEVSGLAHQAMLNQPQWGLLYGPYHPDYQEQYERLEPQSF